MSAQDPVWEEQFDFEVFDASKQRLSLSVFDADLVGRDELIGSLELPILDVARRCALPLVISLPFF